KVYFVYQRSYFFTNDRPISAEVLETVSDPTQPLSFNYFHNYLGGGSDITSVQDADFDVTCTGTYNTSAFYQTSPSVVPLEIQFSNKVHLNSLWFEVETKDRDTY